MTLIEALVVVALTAAIGALLFPRLTGAIDGLAFGQSAALLTADLREGRADALRGDRRIDLRLGEAGRNYQVGDRPERRLPGGLSLAAARAPAVSFFADGSAQPGTLDLIGPRARRLTVAVDPVGAVSGGAS